MTPSASANEHVLGHGWQAMPADEELRRRFAEPDFHTAGWESIEVPGHWRSSPALAKSNGPVLYRTSFDNAALNASTLEPHHRAWLVIDGIFYQGDVWLDGTYVGDTEGYFVPHEFDITEAVASRVDHILAIEATCSPPTDPKRKRNLTGAFQHSATLDTTLNPGGIWRPIKIATTGPHRIKNLRVLCRDADEERARVEIRCEIDTIEAGPARVRTRIDGVEHERHVILALGENQLAWTLTVDQPRLWWPWSLGDQPLYDVEIHLLRGSASETKNDAHPSDVAHRRVGLRRVMLRNWLLSINGETLFVKGANIGPTRQALAEATELELRGDVELARSTGLDLLRLTAHITRPEFYDAADELGVMLWQDLPLQWGYARTVRKQAVRQARASVDLLGHHPSIILWCGHNEPVALAAQGGSSTATEMRSTAYAIGQQVPSFAKTILDRSVKNALRTADPSRPVIAHSGVHPHLPQLDGTDSHLYFGWYTGHAGDLEEALQRIPRVGRFVSEFGTQSVPSGEPKFIKPDQWPYLDWDALEAHHTMQKSVFDEHVPPRAFATFAEWRDATQAYQAHVLKRQIEHLRRLKYAPTGGFAITSLTDSLPAIGFGLVDNERVPKLALEAVRAACAPVIVTADPLPATVVPGQSVDVEVHVVSDKRDPINSCRITARLVWTGGDRTWEFAGDISADRCERIACLPVVVPHALGPLWLELLLAIPNSAPITNHYNSTIVSANG